MIHYAPPCNTWLLEIQSGKAVRELIYGLISSPEGDQRALNFAVAASCLKHTIYGDRLRLI